MIAAQQPVKVLHLISPTGFYGAERWIVALDRNLDISRVHSTVAVTSEDAKAGIELLEHLPATSTVERLEMRGRFDWRVVAKLMHVIRQRGIQVLHSHGYKSDIIGALAARRCGIPCLTTPHGFNDRISFKLKLFIAAGTWSYRYFDRLVPLSEALCRQVEDMGIPPNKITYIANGVDLTEIDRVPPRELVSGQKTTRLGFVGQMIPRKRVDHVIRAFDRLWHDDASLSLSLIGDGSDRAALEHLAETLPSASNIEFLGFRDDRLALVRSFDVFLMASAKEGVPRAMMEAMALGVPVVAYDIPGVDLLIRDGKTGLLAEAEEPDALYRRCRELLAQPEQAAAMGRCARQLVHERFSAARMAKEYEMLYEELAGRACAA